MYLLSWPNRLAGFELGASKEGAGKQIGPLQRFETQE